MWGADIWGADLSLVEGYWPKVAKEGNESAAVEELARQLSRAKKYVFMRSARNLEWENVERRSGSLRKELTKLKRGAKDSWPSDGMIPRASLARRSHGGF